MPAGVYREFRRPVLAKATDRPTVYSPAVIQRLRAEGGIFEVQALLVIRD
jgi:hypothetical protein